MKERLLLQTCCTVVTEPLGSTEQLETPSKKMFQKLLNYSSKKVHSDIKQ